MSTYKELGSVEMASLLAFLSKQTSTTTGSLSAVDQALDYWRQRYPELGEAAYAFGLTRDAYQRGSETWPQVQAAARVLSEQIASLGDVQLHYCEVRTNHPWPCTGVLDDDGRCPYQNDHA